MTNSEAIEQLVYVRRNLDEYLDEDRINTVNIAISVLEENDKLKAEIEQLKLELEQLSKFKEYFMELYNQGLEVSNWHLNGDLEPLTNFIDSALEEAEQHLKGKVKE